MDDYYGSPEAYYEAVLHALASENVWHALNVIDVTKRIAPKLPYGTRKDIERVIAEELFHKRVNEALAPAWAELNTLIGGLP